VLFSSQVDNLFIETDLSVEYSQLRSKCLGIVISFIVLRILKEMGKIELSKFLIKEVVRQIVSIKTFRVNIFH
jgi:hypothetical protein